MTQYINKNEVENILRKLWKEDDGHNSEHRICYNKALQEVQYELDNLEVKKEILDKKSKTDLMRKCVNKSYKRGYDMGVVQTTNKIKHNTKDVNLEKALSDLDREIKDFVTTDEFEKDSAIGGHYWAIAKHAFLLGLKVQNGS